MRRSRVRMSLYGDLLMPQRRGDRYHPARIGRSAAEGARNLFRRPRQKGRAVDREFVPLSELRSRMAGFRRWSRSCRLLYLRRRERSPVFKQAFPIGEGIIPV